MPMKLPKVKNVRTQLIKGMRVKSDQHDGTFINGIMLEPNVSESESLVVYSCLDLNDYENHEPELSFNDSLTEGWKK